MAFQYCTYFDSNYFLRGLSLYHSLKRHEPQAELWVLCLDETSFDSLSRLAYPGLRPVPLADLERAAPRLLAVKPERSKVEYYWTSGPTWLRYVLDNNPDSDGVVYMDGDLFVFAPLTPLFEELGEGSVLIHEHRFSRDRERQTAELGRFNVGTMVFRNDERGMACLEWWREKCLEWCGMTPEPGRFGDQKYLDQFPELFQGVRILSHIGIGVASWNVSSYDTHFRNGVPMVDGCPILIYHFQGIHVLNPSIILNFGVSDFTPALRRIFTLYTRAISETWRDCMSRGVHIGKKQLDAKKKLNAFKILKAIASGKMVFANLFLSVVSGFPGYYLRKALGK